MNVNTAILSRRSIRRFKQKPISITILKKLVNAARLAPSAANLQPLEFFIVNNHELCDKVFETLSWAGYIKPEWRPNKKERPVAYILILSADKDNPWYQRDTCLAAENILLLAESMDIGSCILGKIDKPKLKEHLNIPEDILIDLIIALGYKGEHPVVEDLKHSVEYYRDKNNVLHVPKRKLEKIIHVNIF